MKMGYGLNYDMVLDKAIRKKERAAIQESLLALLKQNFGRTGKIKDLGRNAIRLSTDKCNFHLLVGKSLRFGVSLDRPTERELGLASEVSNTFIGFVSSMSDRSIKSFQVDCRAFIPLRRKAIQLFMQRGTIADFSAKLKMRVNPVGLIFESRTDEGTIFASLAQPHTESVLLLNLTKKSKTPQFDVVRNTHKFINSLCKRFVEALRV